MWEEEDDEGLWEPADNGHLWGQGDDNFGSGIPTVVVNRDERPHIVSPAEKISFVQSEKGRINVDKKEMRNKLVTFYIF